jgi:methionyl-tRNA synthetase
LKTIYITSPLYYVNAAPHIGHAYTEVACDTIARFEKQSGREIFFMTGTDEHGEKIEKATLERGYKEGEEKKFVDSMVPAFRKLWDRLGIEYDYFIRTTDDYHIKSVQAVLGKLREKGKIYKKAYKGWFCTPCETFWSENQAADGTCPDCKRPLERLDEENYFLKISEYQKWLVDYIKANDGFIRPDFRRNEVLGFLNEPLMDLCISRPKSRMGWGIEIPFDRNFVTYVWFDALINYISGIGYPHDMDRFGKYWPCDMHLIGKDILRHHAVYWPIILKALDLELPKTIFAHGWWVIAGEKMSKSKGNVVEPAELIEKYGADAVRYYLLGAVRFGLDGNFSEALFVNKYNADLANDLGNLVNRTLTMIEKYFGGVIPAAKTTGGGEKRMPTRIAAIFTSASPDFSQALKIIWEAVKDANKSIEESAPWNLHKNKETEKLAGVIYELAQILGAVSISLYPFMPGTARAIWAQLGMKSDAAEFRFSDSGRKNSLWGIIPSGKKIDKQKPLFPRIVKK